MLHLTQSLHEQLVPTFPLAAVVGLWLLARLQVGMRQGVVCGWSAQQLLRTGTVQAVLTAVGGPSSLRGTPQSLTLPT